MLDAFVGAREHALSLSLMVVKGPSEIRNAGRLAGAFLTGLKMHGLVCRRDEFLSLFRSSVIGRAAYAFSRQGVL